jgi:hypothetical protein
MEDGITSPYVKLFPPAPPASETMLLLGEDDGDDEEEDLLGVDKMLELVTSPTNPRFNALIDAVSIFHRDSESAGYNKGTTMFSKSSDDLMVDF